MIVQTYILRGKPVISSNTHRATVRAGRAFLRSSAEFRKWKEQAVKEIDDQIKTAGYDVQPQITTIVKKKRKIQTRKNLAPIFTHRLLPQGYYITLWLYAPRYTYKRDENGVRILTKSGEPHRLPFNLDLDNIVKGVYDVLQKAGAIDNDKWARPGPVYPKYLPDDSEPFVCILIEPAQEAPDCPFLPVDSSVYMPRVYEGSKEWARLRKQQEAIREQLREQGIEETPRIAKCRCARCHIFIGQGYIEQQIWVHWGADIWAESRWKKEVVLICGNCARGRMRHEDTEVAEKISIATIEWLRLHGPSGNYDWDKALEVGSREHAVYVEARRVVSKSLDDNLFIAYAAEYRLVSSDEIGSVAWSTIEERRRVYQEKLHGGQSHKPNVANSHVPRHRPHGKSTFRGRDTAAERSAISRISASHHGSSLDEKSIF